MSDTVKPKRFSLKRKSYLALALTMLLGMTLRFYRLEAIPVGLSGDEGADGFGAKQILSGKELPLFITADFGEEPMHTYLVASSFAIWGISLWAIRFVSAFVGLLTIPVVFWLARELFPDDESSSYLMGVLSAFWVATSYWHIIYSRAGLEVVTLPLFSSALIYLLWRGIRSERRWPFVVAGLLLGASLYAYRGARFLPIFLVIFFAWQLIADRGFRRRHLANLALVAVVSAAVFAPLAAYGLAHPDIFFARETHVSIFNPQWGRGSPLQAFAVAFTKTMGMFNLQGDPEFDRNPGRRPVLDPLNSLFFLIGVAVALWKWKRPNYRFVLLWFLVMALPGAFTAEVLPHFHRGIGALPALGLLSAIGLVSFKEWWGARMSWRGARQISWAILSVTLISTSILSCRDYFGPWEQKLSRQEVIGSTYIEAASVMNATRIPDGVWILPATALRPRELPFYEVDYLYDGPEPEYTLNLDEATAPAELSEICTGHRQAAIVTWKYYTLEEAYLSLNSDPKGLLDFLLRKYGRRIGEQPYESFDLVTYELPQSPGFTIVQDLEPSEVDFADELRLTGIAFGGSSLNPTSTPEEVAGKELPSGKEAWLVLQWEAIDVPSNDYKVAAYLVDRRGRLVGQVDKLLLSNRLQPTSRWSSGQVEMDYYTLPSVPAIPPGEYKIEVAVYNPQTVERLTIFDEREGVTKTSLAVGTLQVTKPLEPADVQPLERPVDAEGDIAPGIQLLGYDWPSREVNPGETISMALYWQALEDLVQDYMLVLTLKDAAGDVWLEQRGRPVDDTYPTTAWEQGEVLRDWHDLAVPAETPEGQYQLSVGLWHREALIGEAALGHVQVRGRARQFAVPETQHVLKATLGETVRFLGYDLSSDEVQPGEIVHLKLYWQALGKMETSYTVFTHLLDAAEQIWGQRDSIPGGGALPTTTWAEGEVITDEYEIAVNPEAPPGEYLIEIGMYDASSGTRLPVQDADGLPQGNRILLKPIRVAAGS